MVDTIPNDDILGETLDLLEKIEKGKFYIVVLGLFKRGKSSFINALFGRDILPTGLTPLTSIITLIDYNIECGAEIIFTNREIKNISIESIKEYIAEDENPNNIKNVHVVKVNLDSDILKNCTLIDTPGIGSSFEHNTLKTYQFVHKIDAAIFMLSADIPITQLELKFLSYLKSLVPKILFIFNKTDLYSNNELQDVIKFNENVIRQLIESDGHCLFPVSSKLALLGKQRHNEKLIISSNINLAEEKINSLFLGDKEKLLIKSSVAQFESILNRIDILLNLKLNSLLMPVDVLEKKLLSFRHSIEIMEKDKMDFNILMQGKVHQLQNCITDKIDKSKHKIIQFINDYVFNDLDFTIEEVKNKGISAFQKEFYPELINRLEKLKLNLEEYAKREFKTILNDYNKKADNFLIELIKNLSTLTEGGYESIIQIFDLNIYTGFYYKLDTDFIAYSLKNTFIIKILPKLVIRLFILPKIISNLNLNVEANCGGLNYDVTYKIQESFRKFQFDLNKKLNIIINSFGNIINNTILERQKKELDIEKEVQLFKSRINELLHLKQSITR
jgi:ribosome biogenesis GTPase A